MLGAFFDAMKEFGVAKKKDTTDIKSRRCPHCLGTELVCRLHKQCCEECPVRGRHEDL